MASDRDLPRLSSVEHARAEVAIARHAARADALVRTAARLNTQLDTAAILKAVCEETIRALNVPAASVSLYDERRNVIYIAELIGLPADFRQRAQPMPRELYDEYIQQYGPLTAIPDLQALSTLPDAELYAAINIRSVAIASMLREGQLIGLLSAFTLGEVRQFDDDDLALLKGLADQAAQAISNANLYAQANRRLAYMQALHAVDVAITSSLDVRLTLNIFLEQLMGQLNVDAADVLLLNPETHFLEYAAGRGFHTRALQQAKLRVGEGYAGQVALERRMLNIPNLQQKTTPLDRAPLIAREGFVSYYVLPLIAKGQIKGVLEIFHRSLLEPDQEWLNFLEALARQAAIAIDNAALFDSLQRSNVELTLAYDATIEGWSRALDLRDKETEGHTIRVTETTLRLARELDIPKEDLVHIRRGALLHDIGKMAIPDHILYKPGPLNDQEWEVMRRHPVYAYQMLSPVAPLRPSLDIPYSHHERWDGSGYPLGLKGEQIPLAARVFTVVDVWDALRSNRPYRPAWREPQVRDYLHSGVGTHFDPQVVDAFLALQPQHPD